MVSFPRKDISGIVLKASSGPGCACARGGPSSFFESGDAKHDSTEGSYAVDIAALCSIAAGIVLSACGSGGAGATFIFYGCAKFVLEKPVEKEKPSGQSSC